MSVSNKVIPSLKIRIPNFCQSEQKYALDVLLNQFLGLTFDVETYLSDVIEITKPDASEVDSLNMATLTLDASFFHKAHHSWLKPESMPVFPMKNWNLINDGIEANLVAPTVPVIYGKSGLVKNGDKFHLNLDIFGSAFFMLSRYEELITKDRDKHDRFPATSSVAFKEGFLERPIINEYLEILWACMKQLWPDLKRRKRRPATDVSCDVDDPFDCLVNHPITLLKTSVMDVLKRRDIKLAIKRVVNLPMSHFGVRRFDPYNTFEWYMNICSENNLQATFYFIVDNTAGKIDGCYSVYEEKITKLIGSIINNGHKIGVHGSYNTYKNQPQVEKEYFIFQRELVEKYNYNFPIGIRQHYLRVDYSQTHDILDRVGYDYDASGGYADSPGFRFGVCYDFPMWSFINKRKLHIVQKPLIAMDVTFYASCKEMKIGMLLDNLKKKCHMFNGTFSILWHNSQLYSGRKEVFSRLLGSQHD